MNTNRGKTKLIPEIRFSGFSDEWELKQVSKIVNRITDPVEVENETEYREIGIRSHGKGIFYKDPVKGKDLGNKRVFWVRVNVFVVNIVFAWEHAVAKTSQSEVGMIASHRFPMYSPIESKLDLDFLLYFFLRKRGKYLLGLASPGGAGRNKTLGQQAFAELKIVIPKVEEQKKISSFLCSVDILIENLEKQKTSLEEYKKGMMQKIFSQEVRFKDESGSSFPNWDKDKISNLFFAIRGKGLSKNQVVDEGSNECILYGDLYTKYGEVINKVLCKTNSDEGEKSQIGDLLIPCSTTTTGIDLAIVSAINIENVQLGGDITILRAKKPKFVSNVFYAYYLSNYKKKDIAKYAQGSTIIHLYFSHFKREEIAVPSYREQEKIASFLASIDDLLKQVNTRIELSKKWRDGLLQQMFV